MESPMSTKVLVTSTRSNPQPYVKTITTGLRTDIGHENPSKLNETQRIILECLRETGIVVAAPDIDTQGDLGQILENSGLDSPSMLIFKANLERRLCLKASIPITSLIQARTIQALEDEIMKVSIASNRDLLLHFATGGTRTPLFLFPPGGGELHCWIELVRRIQDRPLYGLRLRGLQPEEPAFGTVGEMVESFVGEIRRVQPRGPYAFLGMCFGGNVAFEVAKAIEATGEVVAFVGGIDNAPNVSKMSFATLRFFILDLLATRRIITLSEANQMKHDLRDQDPAALPRLVMRRFRTRVQSAGVTRERLESWHRVFRGTVNMAGAYVPQGKIASYTSFWTHPLAEWEISNEEWEISVREWRAFAHSSSFHCVGGNHYTALTVDHVDGIKTILDRELQIHGV